MYFEIFFAYRRYLKLLFEQNVISYFAFVLLSVGIAIPHKISNVLTSVHFVQSIENRNGVYFHIEEIRIDKVRKDLYALGASAT